MEDRIREQFPNLILRGSESETFSKYLSLKGIYLHKHIYDVLKSTNDTVTYSELSTIIRYDKYIRDVLYKYLSALEEQWRSSLFDKFEYDEDKQKILSCEIKSEKVKPKNRQSESIFYWATFNKNFTLGTLIKIIKAKKIELGVHQKDEELDKIKELRDKIMHHNLVLFSHFIDVGKVEAEIACIETSISYLWSALDDRFRAGLEHDINLGNFKGGKIDTEAPNLSRFCLRRFKNGVFI